VSSRSRVPASRQRAACRRSAAPTGCGDGSGRRTWRRRRRSHATPASSGNGTNGAGNALPRPNAAHVALAALESRPRVPAHHSERRRPSCDGRQPPLVELHGSLWRVRCTGCDERRETGACRFEQPPRACGALLRPDVVWFGGPRSSVVGARVAACRGSLVINTSSLVYPAASLQLARASGAFVVEVNPEQTSHADSPMSGCAAPRPRSGARCSGRAMRELVATGGARGACGTCRPRPASDRPPRARRPRQP
jgi:hypothetical protein